MKIKIKVRRWPPFIIWIPYFIFKTRLGKRIVKSIKEFKHLDDEQIKLFINELFRIKKLFPKLVVLDVKTKDKEKVKIQL